MKRCFLRGVALHPATVIIPCFHYRLRDTGDVRGFYDKHCLFSEGIPICAGHASFYTAWSPRVRLDDLFLSFSIPFREPLPTSARLCFEFLDLSFDAGTPPFVAAVFLCI